MTVEIDETKFDKVVRVLDAVASMSRRRQKSDAIYFSMFADTFRKVQESKEQGKTVVGHTIFLPTEIFYAMDIVPMWLEGVGEAMARVLGMEDAFAAARSAGFANEICSGHRLINAQAVQGWLPRPDAFVWSNLVCDVTAKTGDFLTNLYRSSGFFLDRPYKRSDEAMRYYLRELEGLVTFLEDLTGRGMDQDRLKEVMGYSKRSQELYREICALRKRVPSPMRNRRLVEMILGQLLLSGTPELVTLYESIRDDCLKMVEQPAQEAPSEKYRLMTFFFYPSYLWKLLDVMQDEYGAAVVTEPHLAEWAYAEIDPSRPLESLAAKAFALDDTGPLEEHFLGNVIRQAEEYQVDGSVYWAHIGCRQTCATIRIVRDALQKEMGIPTLVIDCDLADSAYSPEERVMGSFEQFLELLEENR
jgi:benzoyl-CoA reductase/2-hydroxyglutaryl-CoA dehydratase subunit BcrC/BadD/HgdB